MKCSVGQVLYAILKKEMRVYPLRCIEELHKKSLNGETTSYIVRMGNDQDAQLELSEIDGEIFDSPEKARQYLIDTATANINRLVEVATTKAKEWYPDAFEKKKVPPPIPTKKQQKRQAEQPEPPPLTEHVPEEAQYVILPDGTKARVNIKIPEGVQLPSSAF